MLNSGSSALAAHDSRLVGITSREISIWYIPEVVIHLETVRAEESKTMDALYERHEYALLGCATAIECEQHSRQTFERHIWHIETRLTSITQLHWPECRILELIVNQGAHSQNVCSLIHPDVGKQAMSSVSLLAKCSH